MKVRTDTPDTRTVVIDGTLDELVDLHEALIRNRKTAKDKRLLQELADGLLESDDDVKSIVAAIREEEAADNGEA